MPLYALDCASCGEQEALCAWTELVETPQGGHTLPCPECDVQAPVIVSNCNLLNSALLPADASGARMTIREAEKVYGKGTTLLLPGTSQHRAFMERKVDTARDRIRSSDYSRDDRKATQAAYQARAQKLGI